MTLLVGAEHEPSATTLIAQDKLPVDVAQLVHFVLFDEFAQRLLNSASNTFFIPDGNRVKIRTGTRQSCWDILPQEWRLYFEALEDDQKYNQTQRDQVWADLAAGNQRVSAHHAWRVRAHFQRPV